MRFRIPQITACLVVLLLSCFVVTRSQQVAPVASPTPSPAQSPAPVTLPAPAPEQKAYDEARRIKDPQKKIEALEKVVKDFPDKVAAFQARNDVLDAYIKNFPAQTDKIRAAAEKIFEPSKPSPLALGSSYMNVATKLMDAGLMLDWAQELSTKGSAMYEEEMAKSMRRQRARGQDTLGRIYLKQGKTKQAKTYLKKALTNDPELSSSMIGLGTIAEGAGDHKAAVEYFTSAAVKTPLKKTDRQLMETAYRAMH